MTDKLELQDTGEKVDTPEAGSEALRHSRRRMLKAGAIIAPAVVTLKGNPAWAMSVLCTNKLVFPVKNKKNKHFLKYLLKEAGVHDPLWEVNNFYSKKWNGSKAHKVWVKKKAVSCFNSVLV